VKFKHLSIQDKHIVPIGVWFIQLLLYNIYYLLTPIHLQTLRCLNLIQINCITFIIY